MDKNGAMVRFGAQVTSRAAPGRTASLADLLQPKRFSRKGRELLLIWVDVGNQWDPEGVPKSSILALNP